MTAPRPLPDADQPWNHPHWSDANGPDLGAWVADPKVDLGPRPSAQNARDALVERPWERAPGGEVGQALTGDATSVAWRHPESAEDVARLQEALQGGTTVVLGPVEVDPALTGPTEEGVLAVLGAAQPPAGAPVHDPAEYRADVSLGALRSEGLSGWFVRSHGTEGWYRLLDAAALPGSQMVEAVR